MSNSKRSGVKRTVPLAFVLAAALALSGCATEATDAQQAFSLAPEPLIYSAGGQVYMACGENTVCLSGVQVVEDDDDKTIRAELSEDNRTLIYIAGYDDSTGSGTLMGVNTDCATEPYTIDTGVYTAEMSSDGTRVLLLKKVSDDSGGLYLYTGEGEPRYLTGGVSPENMGFSPDGKSICFEKDNRLFIKEEGNEAAEAADMTKTGSFYVMNGGRLLYAASNCIYYFSGGETQTEAEDAMVLKVHRVTGTFLYRTDEGLFSKEPGREAKLLIDDTHDTELWMEFEYSGSLYESLFIQYFSDTFYGDRFLITERDYRDMEIMIYEQEIGKDIVEIAESAYCAFIDHNMSNVIFIIFEDGNAKTYLCSRENNGWSEPKMIFDFPFTVYFGDCPEFDSANQIIYCLEHNNYNRPEGGFWRYDIEKGKADKLMDGATGFFLIRDIPYVYTEDGIWKMMDGKPVKIVDDTADRYEDVFIETDGGAFFVTAANDIYFIKDKEAGMIELCRADWVIDPSYGLRLTEL